MEDFFVDDAIGQPLPSRRFRWRWLGFGLLLPIAFASGFLLAQWPSSNSEPRVYSLVRVEPLMNSVFTNDREESERTFEHFLQTQVELVRSPTVLLAALADSKVTSLEPLRRQTDPESWLRENLQVGVVPNTYLIKVSVKGMEPKDEAIVINAVVKSYIIVATSWSSEKYKIQIEHLRDYRSELSVRIAERQKAILDLESSIPESSNEPDRQVKRARLRFAENDLRFLQQLSEPVMLAIERLRYESRGTARISQIDLARGPRLGP